MAENNDLYQKAMDIISELYSDTSVSKAKARENLEALIDEMRTMIEALGEE